MKLICGSKLRFLLLVPILLLVFNCYYHKHLIASVEETMLRQKVLEVTDAINMLSFAVEANPEKHPDDHRLNIIESSRFLDEQPMMYSNVFKLENDQLTSIGKRNFETDFNPLEYPEFIESVLGNPSGTLILGFTPAGGEFRNLHMYYKWMPNYCLDHEKYLVVSGVSKFSIVTPISTLISIAPWINTFINFILNVFNVIVLVMLGNVWIARTADPTKWRVGHVRS